MLVMVLKLLGRGLGLVLALVRAEYAEAAWKLVSPVTGSGLGSSTFKFATTIVAHPKHSQFNSMRIGIGRGYTWDWPAKCMLRYAAEMHAWQV